MAHFAEIDNNYQVIRVLKVDNLKCVDAEGNEHEEVGVEFLKSLYGEKTNWVQTSYTEKKRRMFAGKGYIYLPEQDIFVPPSPWPSWTLNRSAGKWVAPSPEPEHNEERESTRWSEDEQKWYVEEDTALADIEAWKRQQSE